MEYGAVFAQELIAGTPRGPRAWRRLLAVRVLVALLALTQPFGALGAPADGDDAPGHSHEHGEKQASFDDLPEGTIAWKRWDCPTCGRKGNTAQPDASGHQSCAGCGKGRPPGVPDYLPGAGPAGKQDVAVSDIARPETVRHAESGKQIVCPHCGRLNFETARTCTSCGSPVKREQPPRRPSLPALRRDDGGLCWQVYAAAGAAAVGVAGLVYWGTREKELEGDISEANWRHDVELQRFQRVTRGGWLEDLREEAPVMPVAGRDARGGVMNIRNERVMEHSKKKVQIGTEEYLHPETYTVKEKRSVVETYQEPYEDFEWKDLGNGAVKKVKVTKYRPKQRSVTKEIDVEKTAWIKKTRPVMADVPVMKTYVDYDTFDWVTVDKKSESGSSFVPGTTALPWPEFNVGPNERTVRQAKYGVVVTVNGERKTVETKDEAALLRWNVGQKATVTKNNFSTINSIEPK